MPHCLWPNISFWFTASNSTCFCYHILFAGKNSDCCHILGEEQDPYKQILPHFRRQWFKNLQSYAASSNFSITDNLKGQENYKKIKLKLKLILKNTIIEKTLTYASETSTLTNRDRKILNIFERKVYRRISGPVYDNEKENWRILTNKEIYTSVKKPTIIDNKVNPLNAELNPICYLLALLGAHHFLHVSRIRVKLLTFRRLMSYIYIRSTHSWCF